MKVVVDGSTQFGRPSATSHAELERISLAMFAERGFDQTSIDDIAAAAGIGRRTFFRYFKSKNDAVWGDFDGQLTAFEAWFRDCPAEMPLLDAICAGVITFNSFDETAADGLRSRMTVILSSPALQAHSTLRYAAWRDVVSRFAAGRLGVGADALVPRALGHLALGAALAAYEQWLTDEGSDLLTVLRQTLALLAKPLPEPT